MDASAPLSLVIEFGRVESTDDPYDFHFKPQDYFLRHGQGGYDTVRFPWTQELLRDLEAVRRPGRDSATVQRLGDALREFLLTTDWPVSEAQILAAVERGQPIHLTVRSAAAEVYALPWELLTVQPTGQHLGELPSLLLRYAWPNIAAFSAAQPVPAEPGRILFAWSAAAGAVPALEHTQAIARACAKAGQPFDPTRDVLKNASCGQLLATLSAALASNQPISVLHLLGHGAQKGNAFGLALNGEVGEAECVVVDAAQMRKLLGPFAGMVRLVVLAACDSGNSGAFGNHLGSIAQELHRGRIAQVVASRYPLSVAGSISFAESFYAELFEKPASVEDSFVIARQQLTRGSDGLDWASVQLYSAIDADSERPISFRPYRGFLPFLQEHSRFFFGREREATELIARVMALQKRQAARFFAICGASGIGKSSLLFAAAVAPLCAQLGENTKLVQLRPGQSQERSPTEFLLAHCPSDGPLLLVIDQFEELFTHCDDEAERHRFSIALGQLATSTLQPVSVIVTLRSDFFDQASALPIDANGQTLGPLLRDGAHCLLLLRPTLDMLRRAIEKPAQRVGLFFEAGLVERMLQDLEREPGALPLLEHVLDLLWQERRGNRLTQAACERMGGVSFALHAHAELLIDSFSEEEQLEAQRILLWLGGKWTSEYQGTRRRISVAALAPESAAGRARFYRVLSRLIDERLLVGSCEADDTGDVCNVIEVAHETLLRKWQRLLRWVKHFSAMLAARETLEHWAAEWRRHGVPLKGNQLGHALLLKEQFPEALSKDATTLLAESQAAQTREEALFQRGIDALRFLAAQSAFGDDSTRMALALCESKYVYCSGIPGWLETALDICHNHVLMIAEAQFDTGASDAAFSPSGDAVVVALEDGSLNILSADLTASRILDTCTKEGLAISVRYSPDGDSIVTFCADGTAHVLSAFGDGERLCLSGHEARIDTGSISRDGQLIATASADGTARLYDATSGKLITTLCGHSGEVIGVVISPDKRRVYTASTDGTILVFTLEGRGKKVPAVFADEGAAISALALSACGTKLATGSSDGRVRVYDTANSATPLELPGHRDKIWALSFSPDGSRLLSASADQTARLWYLDQGRPPCILRGHQRDVFACTFNRDGTRILTASPDGRVRIWDATRAQLLNPKVWKSAGPLPDDLLYETQSLALTETLFHSPNGDVRAEVIAQDSVRVELGKDPDNAASFGISTGGDPIIALHFTPDGRKLIVIGRKIFVCDLKTQTILCLPGHKLPITCCALSADGQCLVTGSSDWLAKVWSLSGVKPHRVLTGHDNALSLVWLSADGGLVLTVEARGATRLWPKNGPPIILLPKGRWDHTIAVSADLSRILTQGKEDALLYLWDIGMDHTDIKRRLRAATPHELSAEERIQLFLDRMRF